MAIIDPEGLFGGDRLRRCSNAAQLHWRRLLLASDGFARLEINFVQAVLNAVSTADLELGACDSESAIQTAVERAFLHRESAETRLEGRLNGDGGRLG
jgi:hypothetical protein